ncbi:MAG: NAD-dependent epimerase/dehydratase family protein [Verrucomicrobia bacterium]|jgi:nucleoside-diphosphate-sugar epimerase|nr:NAD-dependent epimerase/dehydratase family protein [Verrucomicrobiota bacterium]
MSTTQELPSSVFIFGCGYVGTALARHLLAAGVRVGALTRNAEKVARLRELGLDPVIEGDLNSEDWHAALTGRYDAVVNCVSSAGGGLAGYRKSYLEGQRSILKWAQSQDIKSYVYTSSTSVYPQDGGVMVDESSDTAEAPPTGQVVRESEALLEEAAHLGRWYVLRLAGIYGPGRHYLLDQLRGGAEEIPGSGDYALNMIHRDDIVSAICSALAGRAESGIYNIADDAPTTKAEVLADLAKKLGLPKPVFNPAIVSERLKRRGGRMPNRRISNAKAKAALDWAPKYPSYREGYAALV